MRGPSVIYVLNDLKELQYWHANFGPSSNRGQRSNFLPDIVRELCQRAPQQLFEYTANVSPNGGPELDDLAISDSTDPRQAVLVIAVETESTLYVYRRVYSGSP